MPLRNKLVTTNDSETKMKKAKRKNGYNIRKRGINAQLKSFNCEQDQQFCVIKNETCIIHKTKTGRNKIDQIVDTNELNVLISDKKYSITYQCEICKHTLCVALEVIIRGSWCTYCAGKQICERNTQVIAKDDGTFVSIFCKVCYDKSFASHWRSIFWHSKKNDQMLPNMVLKGTHKKYWFQCTICWHSFEMSINAITREKSSWCPYCSIPCKKICDDAECEWCYKKSFASHDRAKSWHPTKNGTVVPRNIMRGSHKKCWFTCCHDVEIIISDICSNGSWCAFCSKPCQRLCNKKCNKCWYNSFKRDNFAKFWHPQNNILTVQMATSQLIETNVLFNFWTPNTIKNALRRKRKKKEEEPWQVVLDVQPRQVVYGSHEKFDFICPGCKHTITKKIGLITQANFTWCPYCNFPDKVGPNQKLCNDTTCMVCFKGSFASHEKAKHWHKTKNGEITPRDVFKCTAKKYWFTCHLCGHDFDSQISVLTYQNCWCPYCCIPRKKLCDDPECTDCFKGSFASHVRAKFWDVKKNKDTPREISLYSNQKRHFICEEGHSWKPNISNVTCGGKWCPKCLYKTQAKVYKFLKEENHVFETEYGYGPIISKEYKIARRFDIVFTALKKIFEIDGPQHDEEVNRGWMKSTLFCRQIWDKWKEFQAREAGYIVFRFSQVDILKDKIDWKAQMTRILNN
jgi:hypothetical protein